MTSLLSKLQNRLCEVDFRDLRESQSVLETLFHPILGHLLHLHYDIYKEVEKLPAVRYATRVEAYRRLWRAYDFIEASFLEPISLSRIAEAAELSAAPSFTAVPAGLRRNAPSAGDEKAVGARPISAF